MSAQLHIARTPVEDALVKEVAENAGAEAASRFAATGLPHRRVEEWKYTDIRSSWREPLSAAPQPDAKTIAAAEVLSALPDDTHCNLTFVNGWLISKTNVPDGVTIKPAQNDNAIKFWDDPMMDLNTALTGATVMITVPTGLKLEKPLHLSFRMAGPASSNYPRVHIQVGEGSEASIIESHFSGDETYALNSTVVITCGAHSKVTHTRLQVQGANTLNVISTDIRLGAKAQFKAFALEQGAQLSRNQYFVRQSGEGAQIELAGVSLGRAHQHHDTTLTIDHAMPQGASREVFKIVLADEAKGVFQGKIIVRPDAQKTDGQMSARGLLLSDDAAFFAKPELEIYADDVLCAHGATAGALDDDLLFYLRARGLDEPSAKALLVAAFIGEAIETVDDPSMREDLTERARTWLAGNLK